MSLTYELTIHKFPVNPGPFTLRLPRLAKVLDAQMQNDEPQMWVLLDPDEGKVERRFVVLGTGHKMEGAKIDQMRHISTFQMGALVWHLFEVKP